MFQNNNKPVEWNDLPPYLAFGIAHLPSKRIVNDTHYLEYHFQGQKIYEVQLSSEKAKIVQYWDGEEVDRAQGKTLVLALEALYYAKSFYNSPLHESWFTSVSKAGNVLIRFVYGDEPKKLIYPSLQRQQVVIPVPTDEPERQAFIEKVAQRFPHRIHRFDGILAWRRRSDGVTQKEAVVLVRVVLPVAYVQDFMKEVNSAIIPGRLWRAYADPYHGEEGVAGNHYQGNPQDDFSSYTLLATS